MTWTFETYKKKEYWYHVLFITGGLLLTFQCAMKFVQDKIIQNNYASAGIAFLALFVILDITSDNIFKIK